MSCTLLSRRSATRRFVAAIVAVGLGIGCSDTDEPPPARHFSEVQVAGTFPIHIADDGTVTRICGAPLNGSPRPVANGLQFAVNLVADSVGNDACPSDLDFSVHAGEQVDRRPVSAEGTLSTVDATRWSLQLDCMNDEASKDGACVTKAASVLAQSVGYVSYAPRCAAGVPSAAHRVAVVMDYSGSVNGASVVQEGETAPVGTEYDEELVLLEPKLGELASDPFNLRIAAARRFVSALNPTDRVISYRFGDGGVALTCSGARTCSGGPNADQPCDRDADCGADPSVGACVARPALVGTDRDPYQLLSEQEGEARCFAASQRSHTDNSTGLDLLAKLGAFARAPLWRGIAHAYDFFRYRGGTGPGPAHIVVFADGPDTCNPDEDFESRDVLKQQPEKERCMQPCSNAVGWQKLLEKMRADGFPVHVHIIQFQSKAYLEPEPRLQDLACLSGGTYQFIRSTSFGPENHDVFSRDLALAVDKVRSAMAGQWLVNFPVGADGLAAVPVGQQLGLRGQIRLANPALPSLAFAFDPVAVRQPHKFGMGGADDDRLSVRVACSGAADCGGSNPCASNRCSLKGVCSPEPAPSYLPCGEDSVCCNSTCVLSTVCFDQQVCKPSWPAP